MLKLEISEGSSFDLEIHLSKLLIATYLCGMHVEAEENEH